MRRYTARLCAVMVGVTALVVCLSPAANAGSVQGQASLWRKQSLAEDPTSTMSPSCQSRSIYLAAGYYQWDEKVYYTDRSPGDPNQYVVLGWGAEWENLRLAGDWYTWSTCLYPENNEYYQISSLTRRGYTDGSVIDHTYGTPDDFWHTGDHIWGDNLTYYGNSRE